MRGSLKHLMISAADYRNVRAEAGEQEDTKILQALHQMVAARCGGRRLIVSKHGITGIGPAGTRNGDFICVLLGSKVPFVLRQTKVGWSLIGECLVGGIMDGEALANINCPRTSSETPEPPLQDFEIF